MKTGLIGVQMMMLGGKVREMGAHAVLERLAEIGYHCIEISQIPMTPENVTAIRNACEAFDIKVAACSAMLEPMGPPRPGVDTLEGDFDKIVADCQALDTNFLRIPILPFGYMGNREKALDLSPAQKKWLSGWPSTRLTSTTTITMLNSKNTTANT